MNIIGWIRQGDKAACGGAVAEGDPNCISDGRPYAFHGARVTCKKNCVITEGYAHSTLTNGRSQVIHGMVTSGGCPLISTLNDVDGVGDPSGKAIPTRFVQGSDGAWAGKSNEGFDQHFVLTDEQTGKPLPDRFYRMTFNGKVVEGKSDAEGYR
jgi:uncharacterized Zn-binding protein involved in type VI secretion